MVAERRRRALPLEIRIADDLAFPLEIVTESVGVFGKRRMGKSNLQAVFVEQLYAAGQQVVILDPKGDWWGLRSSADGTGPGLPIVIFGGAHGDLPLEVGAREELARFVVEQRVSVLLDLSSLRKYEVAEFLGGPTPPRRGDPDGFLEALYRLKAQEQFRSPCMVVFEEADAIAPMKPDAGQLRMLGAADDIVRRGGQRGLGSIVASQRPAVVHTNIRTQVQVLMLLRLIGHHDIKAIDDWIDAHGTLEQRAELLRTIASLPVGTAWAWSPGWPTEDGIFQRAQIYRRSTFDSGATPKPGETRQAPRTLADVDLQKLAGRLASTIEKAKADDPRELRKNIQSLHARIAELERQLRDKPIETKIETKVEIKEVRVEVPVPVISEDELARLDRLSHDFAQLSGELAHASQRVFDGAQMAVRRTSNGSVDGSSPSATPSPVKQAPAPRIDTMPHEHRRTSTPRPSPTLEKSQSVTASFGNDATTPNVSAPLQPGDITAKQRRILDTLASFEALGLEAVDRKNVAVFSGRGTKSSAYDVDIAALGRKELVITGGGQLRLSEEGRARAATPEATPTTEALREAWYAELTRALNGNDARARLLRILVEAYPNALTRAELADAAGMSSRSSAYDVHVAALSGLGLARTGGGQVVATELLFPALPTEGR